MFFKLEYEALYYIFLYLALSSVKYYLGLIVIAPLRSSLSNMELALISVVFSLPGMSLESFSAFNNDSNIEIFFQTLFGSMQGLLYGGVVAALFECFALIGKYCDVFRGAQYAEQATSITEHRVSSLEEVMNYTFCTLFFSSGAACLFLEKINNENFSKNKILHLLDYIKIISLEALSLTFGVAICLIAYEFVLGIAARVSSKWTFYFELSALKIILGLFLAWIFILRFGEFQELFKIITRFLS